MRVLVLGADGYLGWPTAMYLSMRGHSVGVVDSFAKRRWEESLGVRPLVVPRLLGERVRIWRELTGREMASWVGDLTDERTIREILEGFRPDAIVHYGEQPSAPFSMIDASHAALTQQNNIIGTLNLAFAMKDLAPDAHLVKLGTMGEYGTPNIDIEEGYLDIEHNGRKDRIPFPKQPGSFYHLSKVHDSHNLTLASRLWDLRVTDLNQGVVYGISSDETDMDLSLSTSFHYDAVFGTVLNRFCVEAILGVPLTVYGGGMQRRAFLNIRDTLRCVELAVSHPAERGEFRVFNQFTEQFSLNELADTVVAAARVLGITASVSHLPNPRMEAETHYYNPKNSGLLQLGLEPRTLSDELVKSMLLTIREAVERHPLHPESLLPQVWWHATPRLRRSSGGG